MSLSLDAGTAIHRAASALTRALAGLRGRTQLVDGVPWGYDERPGDGTPIVLLHGFSADREAWSRFAAALKGRHLIIPDQLGHGQTPFVWGADYSAPAAAGRVLALLDALGVDRFHLAGNSMGGFIAAHVAVQAPRRVISAGLIDPAGVGSREPSPLDRMVADGQNPFLLDSIADFDAFYGLTMARPPFVPGIVLRSIGAEYVGRRPQLETIWDGFHGRDLLSRSLDQIISPTWIAWGARDEIIDVTAAERWDAGVPDATLTIYDDLGHMPMLEAPGRVAADYRAFLAEVESDPDPAK